MVFDIAWATEDWCPDLRLALYNADKQPAATRYGEPSCHLRVDVAYVDNALKPELVIGRLFYIIGK